MKTIGFYHESTNEFAKFSTPLLGGVTTNKNMQMNDFYHEATIKYISFSNPLLVK